MTTIGVAVPVPDPWGAELRDYRVRLGDATAAGIPTHITLLAPAEVEDVQLPVVHEHLASVAAGARPFAARLRGTGTFRPVSPVVFVNVVEGIAGCELLAADVRRGPLPEETRFPYHPHVTVAHHLDEHLLDRAFDDLTAFECRFSVDQFWLYEHCERTGWTPVRAFRLGSPADSTDRMAR